MSDKAEVFPDTENPTPLTVMEVTETAALPETASVKAWVVGEFKTTFPNERLVALTFNPGANNVIA